MSKQTLAELLGVSITTMTDWTTKGLLKTCRPTLRVTRFLWKDVIAFLEQWTV
ncbi:helix-turn-helix domain-containing protein [Verrucomicrobium sp. 3C]|uniref:helix-turn-helix domain-containing protein n=1 Tax=Verrucomicrobium sp. 3C TaxID=1134055 RepID=UPI000379397F|nr:helix-turn-helix domain-containing protein [Verrucomicrobium sp. 3C]